VYNGCVRTSTEKGRWTAAHRLIGAWDVELIWKLQLGTWNFRFTRPIAQNRTTDRRFYTYVHLCAVACTSVHKNEKVSKWCTSRSQVHLRSVRSDSIAKFSRVRLPLPGHILKLRAAMVNLSALNAQQRLAVQTLEGPVLILAGAGTGKTRVITYRIAHMIDRGVAPSNILAVTFTNKAAREMKERVAKLVPKQPEDAGKPTICTFHSLCVRILRRHIEKLGYKSNFVIYDDSEQLNVVKKILSHISSRDEKKDAYAVLAIISKIKNGALKERSRRGDEADPPPYVGSYDESSVAMAKHIVSRYESALRACNAVDFDDLLLLTLRLFREHPEALEECRKRFRYVMVDEYQDTNCAQFDLVHLLTQEHRNLCVVGDDDQSIYGWRGAEIANLLDMEKHFNEVKVVKLEQNYRSTNNILIAANALIKNNVRRRGKNLWSQKGDGEKIVLWSFDNDDAEAQMIVDQIESNRMISQIPWGKHAILFRTNQQSRPFEMALRQAKVKYHLIGGQSFFDRREVRDFLAYLKLFYNPQDDISLLRIANVPARGLSEGTMQRLLAASQERHCSVYTVMRHTDVLESMFARTRQSVESFTAFVERMRHHLQHDEKLPLQVWADKFLDEIGYFDELRRSEKDPEAAESRIRNLKDLISTLDGMPPDYSDPPMKRLETFLEEITLDTEREEENESRGDAVTLITMHSCKGLEFPHVFVVGLEDGLLPHSRSQEEGTLDEERRLFYVAITRAQETLKLSYCHSRTKYGQPLPCHPSRFLKELPQQVLINETDGSAAPATAERSKSFFSALRDVVG
jgi:ATP-dependent DNA helicase UvrD/PcrA